MNVWSKSGAAIAFFAVFSVMAFVIERKGLASQEAAGWAQAFGTVAAIWAAVRVANFHAERESKARADALVADRQVAYEIGTMLYRLIADASWRMNLKDRPRDAVIQQNISELRDAIHFAHRFVVDNLKDVELMKLFMRFTRNATVTIELLEDLKSGCRDNTFPDDDWNKTILHLNYRRDYLFQRLFEYQNLLDSFGISFEPLSIQNKT